MAFGVLFWPLALAVAAVYCALIMPARGLIRKVIDWEPTIGRARRRELERE